MSYEAFIASKGATVAFPGIDGVTIDPRMFDHQAALVRWALRRGRAAIFADTGLGKTLMEIEWATHVAKFGRVLILAPLAVAEQTVREAHRFGHPDVKYLRKDAGTTQIVVANYEMLPHFDPTSFVGVVLDESSILKSYTGSIRTALIESFAGTPYRLACTATPAPNDFTELGNHSEFLGVRSRVEMLAEFFIHDGGATQDWRIRGHAVVPFWKWVASWGAVVKRPSDLGFDDTKFNLPPLRMIEHSIPVGTEDAHAAGFLFAPAAMTLSEQRATRRATLSGRVSRAAELADGDGPCIVWCELNDEADACEAAIDGAIQVRGSDDPDTKRDALIGFADGVHRVMVTKASIAGYGLNWQHCRRMIFVGASHSYEQTYQSIRRCWRFGQTAPVEVHFIRTETEAAIVANYRRKEADSERMSQAMTAQVSDTLRAEIGSSVREFNAYHPTDAMTIPSWLVSETSL